MRRGTLCNVANCNGNNCVHQWAERACPCCGFELIHVTRNDTYHCSNHSLYCDYEESSEKWENEYYQLTGKYRQTTSTSPD
jgi:hypothetical protein